MQKLGFVAVFLSAFALQAATVIDLTTAGASNGTGTTAAVGGNFIVQQVSPQSTGTGVIDSFLRVDANGNATREQGYNTSLTTPFDDKGGVFTRSLLLADVPIRTLNGIDYRQFLLDINQVNSSSLLNLNQIQIFGSSADRADASLNTAASGANYPAIEFPSKLGVTTSLLFQMSAAATGTPQSTILMDYSLNPGSGAGDMFLYVPNSDFAAGLSNVILYSQFGTPPPAALRPTTVSRNGPCCIPPVLHARGNVPSTVLNPRQFSF